MTTVIYFSVVLFLVTHLHTFVVKNKLIQHFPINICLWKQIQSVSLPAAEWFCLCGSNSSLGLSPAASQWWAETQWYFTPSTWIIDGLTWVSSALQASLIWFAETFPREISLHFTSALAAKGTLIKFLSAQFSTEPVADNYSSVV